MARTQSRRPKGRPRLPGGEGRKVKTHTVSSFTASHKIEVLDHFIACDDIETTIRHFYPELPECKYNSRRTLIYSWKRTRNDIEELCGEAGGANKRKARNKGEATILSKEDEADLVRWINELRDEGVPVTPTMLRLQAHEVAAATEISSFKASWCWQHHFKGRHRLSLRCKTRQGQIRPPDLLEIAQKYAEEVKQKAIEIGATRIYNADQTAVFFEYLPKQILAKTGSKTVWVRCGGKTKDRATLMLLRDSDGTKYSPFVVFKMRQSTVKERQEENKILRHGFSESMWKKQIVAAKRDTGMQVYTNTKGWWNSELTLDFLRFHFGSRQDMSEPILLLLDDFSGHWTDEVAEYANNINVTLMKVPPNATSVSQPADATWNGPLSVRLRNRWIQHLRDQLRARQPGVAFKLKAPDRKLLCSWIHATWSDVYTFIISAGFRKCGFIKRPDDNETEEDTPSANTEMHENAGDIIDEVLSAGWLDKVVGAFGPDDDFDDMFRAIGQLNAQ